MEKISFSLTNNDIDKLNKISAAWDCPSISHCLRQIIKKVELQNNIKSSVR